MDQLAHSTDPSSVNSSWDRLQQQQQQYRQQQMADEQHPAGESFGFSGFDTSPDYSQSPFQSYNNNNNANNNLHQDHRGAVTNGQYAAAPAVPPKDMSMSKSRTGTLRKAEAAPQKSEKRKSWFKRFSKG